MSPSPRIPLAPVGAGYTGIFKNYGDANHSANVKLADFNGLLEGLVIAGDASIWISGNATRGECAQVLWNLMKMDDALGPQ
jgi:hypothetical protein